MGQEPDSSTSSVGGNLERLRERIERAASRAGRRAGEITLVGVTKTVPAPRVREAFEAGVHHFGESRVQEAEAKLPSLEDLPVTWHFLGHLQRNKAARAVNLFHTIDSLDSLPLAEKLQQSAGEGRKIPVLIEVLLDPTEAKSGCDPKQLPRMAEGVLLMPRLELRGLMAVPAPMADPQQGRPAFRRLRELRDELARRVGKPLQELSMGMSGDFEAAIEEGATQIRIGTALFGRRPSVR